MGLSTYGSLKGSLKGSTRLLEGRIMGLSENGHMYLNWGYRCPVMTLAAKPQDPLSRGSRNSWSRLPSRLLFEGFYEGDSLTIRVI